MRPENEKANRRFAIFVTVVATSVGLGVTFCAPEPRDTPAAPPSPGETVRVAKSIEDLLPPGFLYAWNDASGRWDRVRVGEVRAYVIRGGDIIVCDGNWNPGETCRKLDERERDALLAEWR